MSEEFDFTSLNRDLDITKSKLFRKPEAAFFGPLLCSLSFHWDESIPTAATDYKNYYWNPGHFIRCRDDNQGEDLSTLMHEIWHNARLHDIRQGSRCPDIWNIACDIWINREMQKLGYFIGSTWVLRPDLNKFLTEEDIYDELKKNNQSNSPKCSHQHNKGGGSPQQAVNAVVKAIQAAKMSGQPGSIPGGIEQIVDKFLSPIIPWEQHLRQWMSDLSQEDFSWARPNRRYMGIE